MIFNDFSNVRVFVRPGVTDMRKQLNGLTAQAKDVLLQDPYSGSLFLFCSEEGAGRRV